MPTTQRPGSLFGPVVVSLIVLAALISLGNWQMRRLAWKKGLIQQIETRSKAAPVTPDEAEALWRRSGDVEYLRVRAAGRFWHGKERYLYALARGRPGWHVYTPLETDGGRLLMVNRGFVPHKLKAPQTRKAGQVAGRIEIVGLWRGSGEKGMFTPANDMQNNVWYWRSLSNMVASVVDKMKVSSYPFFLYAQASATPPGGWPRAGATRRKFPNRHLGYALTWYGLAAALIAVFLAVAWSRHKQDQPPR